MSELGGCQVQLVSQLGQMGGSGAEEEKECRRKLEQLKVQEDSLRAAIKCEDSRDRLSGTGGMDPTPEEQEECLRQIELLQLQEKRMKALVAQRREERREMDLENSRMERQLKFMKEMAVENEEAEEAWQREQDAKKPFSGSGRTLGAPSSSSSSAGAVGGSIGGSAPPPGVAAKSAAATAAAARLFGRPPSESQVTFSCNLGERTSMLTIFYM